MKKRVTLTPEQLQEVVALLEWAAMHGCRNPLGRKRTLELTCELGERELVLFGIAKAKKSR